MPRGPAISFLVLLLTERCNLACRYCYVGAEKSGRDMDPETARNALAFFRPAGKRITVELAGGEPLLRFDLIRALVRDRSGQTFFRFAVQTNGILLDAEKLDFFRRHQVGLGLSLDGPPGINARTRGDGEGVFRALRLLDQFEMGVNITVVLTRINVETLPEFLLFCANHRCVRVINLDLLRPLGRGRANDLGPSPEQLEEMVPHMIQTLDFINARRFPPLKVREVEQTLRRDPAGTVEPYCFAAQGRCAAVGPGGDIYPCASLYGLPAHRAGNIHDPGKPEPAKLTLGTGPPDDCDDCPTRYICRGGCPSRRLAHTGRFDRKCESECALRRAIHQRMIP